MPLLANSPTLPEVGVSPATPASGGLVLFAKTDGLLYSKNDAGLETVLITSATAQTISGVKTFSSAPVVPDGSFVISKLSTTGTANATTFLRGDGSWQTVSVGTAANVVTSAFATANKLTVSAAASPPSSPALNDLWVVSDETSASSAGGFVGEIDHAERGVNFDIAAVGTTWTDVDGLWIDVPAQTQPYIISFECMLDITTGTAAVATNIMPSIKIIDTSSLLVYGYDARTFVQVTAASVEHQSKLIVRKRILPHATARSYKVQARNSLAVPANWGQIVILAGDVPTQGVFPPAFLRAEYA